MIENNKDEEKKCKHTGSITWVETSLMADMTLETVVVCSACKKQMIMKGSEFIPIGGEFIDHVG